MKIKKCCPYCGSDQVKVDAWAEWSIDQQDWVLCDTYSNGWCDACEGEIKTFIDIEVDALVPPYPFCRHPDICAGKGYCPRDPACND